jgi:hypothetical protein
MRILGATKAILSQAPAVSPRIFVERIDQNAQRPNILLKNPESGGDLTQDGLSELLDAHVQVVCRSDTDVNCMALADAVRGRLVDWFGTAFDLDIQLFELDGEASGFDGATNVFTATFDFTVHYTRP